MYNEKQKMGFINNFTNSESTKTRLKKLFNLAEIFEHRLKKDISLFTKKETINFITKHGGKTTGSINSTISLLRQYVSWCINNRILGKDGVNVLDDIRFSDISYMSIHKDAYIGSPEHFEQYADNYGYDVRIDSNDNMAYAALWLSYCGIDDVMNVKKSDVHLEQGYIEYNYKRYKIYPQAIPTLKKALNMMVFSVSRKNGSYVDLQIKDTPYILRLTVPVNYYKMSTMISIKECTGNLTIESTYRSGIYYRMYEDERRGNPLKYTEILNDSGIHKKLPNASQVRDFENDYNQWKKTFGYS